MKAEKVDGSVVAAFVKLHPDGIPKRLRQQSPVKRKGDFDPNVYFTVLRHLSMKPGYMLDYVYYYNDHGGNPCLYARAADETPLKSLEHYKDWTEKNNILSFIVADGTPDSFFQLIVFQILAGQFYLWWHSNYDDRKIITSSDEMEMLIAEINNTDFGAKFTKKQVAALRAVPPEPTVEMFDDSVVVTYCLFSKWGGLRRLKETFPKEPPYQLTAGDILTEVKYSCGVLY